MKETENIKQFYSDFANQLSILFESGMNGTKLDDLSLDFIGVFFLKYISDKFGESYDPLLQSQSTHEAITNKYGSNQTFLIPPEANWKLISNEAEPSKIGKVIDEVCNVLIDRNPILKDVLPHDYARETLDKDVLLKLVALFDTLENSASKENRFNNLYLINTLEEFITRKYSEKEGEAYLPEHVRELLLNIICPTSGYLYDPFMNRGEMLTHITDYIRANDLLADSFHFLGEEHGIAYTNISILKFFIIGMDVKISETFFEPCIQDDQKNDYIISNLVNRSPFYEDIGYMIPSLSESGKMGIVVTEDFLSQRGNRERTELRYDIVTHDLIDTVIALPPAYNYRVEIYRPIYIVILNKKKERPEKVTFIDASHIGKKVDSRFVLEPDEVNLILDIYRNPDAHLNSTNVKYCTKKLKEVIKKNCNIKPEYYTKA